MREDEENIHIYGDQDEIEAVENEYGEKVFDGIKYAVNDGTLHEQSFDPNTRLTTETVGNILDGQTNAAA